MCLHYLINKLQPIPFTQPVVVSLNPVRPIDRNFVMGEFHYAHPVFDLAAIRAQADIATLQGQHTPTICGAWLGYGFHEDGLKSGLSAARRQLLRAACADARLPEIHPMTHRPLPAQPMLGFGQVRHTSGAAGAATPFSLPHLLS